MSPPFARGARGWSATPPDESRRRARGDSGAGINLATLLLDLLTPEEEAADARTAHLGFDIGLIGATDWLTQHPDTRHLPVGCLGASTGAPAALVAAAERPDVVRAVVSRGGRPDLAGPALARVRAPTLLIPGGHDLQVIQLNRMAFAQLRCEKRLVVVPGATHLFEEPGALDEVARLAREWFERWLIASQPMGDMSS